MRKVKRKQIDFGGTDQQYVRGDGELDVKDYFSIKLISQQSAISDIDDETLTCDKTANDIIQAVLEHKNINWYLVLGGTNGTTCILSVSESNINRREQNGSINYVLNTRLYLYDLRNNAYLNVSCQISLTINNTNTNVTTGNVGCFATYGGSVIPEIPEIPEVPKEVVYCTFTTTDDQGNGVFDLPVNEFVDALANNHKIICKYHAFTEYPDAYIELPVCFIESCIITEQGYEISLGFSQVCFDKKYEINAYAFNDSGDSDYSGSLSVQDFPKINDEVLTFGHNGNIHDGFYYPNAIQDYDGNWYGAVVIGDQVWLAENLKSLHYSDGREITVNNSATETEKYASYPNGNEDNVDTYGLLYNFAAVVDSTNFDELQEQVKGISPGTQENNDDIWYIPSYADFQTLANYLSSQSRYKQNCATALCSTTIWSNNFGNNKTGFNLVPAGYYGTFAMSFNTMGSLFSSTYTGFSNNYKRARAFRVYQPNSYGSSTEVCENKLSVRCISKLNPIQFRDWYIRKYGSLQHHLPQSITPDTPETVGDGTLSFNVNNESVTTFTANQQDDSSINFEEGVGIRLAKDDEDRKIIISSESNHTVINKDIVVSSQHQSILYRYIVRCDLNNNELVVGDLDSIVNKSMAYSTENNFVWTKTAQDVDVYFGLCKVQSTDGKYVFKLDIFDAITNKTETHLFGLIVDSPSDSTFTFISTCNWEIVVKSDYTKYALYGYLKVPNAFVGTVTLTPLRRQASGTDGFITCFENDATSITAEYRWEVPVTGGIQALNSVTTLLGNDPSAGVDSVRTPFGNYYVNVLGEFGGNLESGSKVSDSIINDYYLHTIEKRLQNISTAAAIYNLLNLPQPTAGDEGKILIVNSSGQYELINPNNVTTQQ